MADEPLSHGTRKLYEVPKHEPSIEQIQDPVVASKEDLLSYVRKNIVGSKKPFRSAFGTRSVIYCDYTASGRSLAFIEDFIQSNVLPEYGNTHTTTTVTSLQTTLFRHEARDIVRNAVRASEHDAVIFVGAGCTGAVHKLINALNLTQPPVVFVGPFEHHSNLLPWRETGADIVYIEETAQGRINIDHLVHELQVWQSSGRQLIGSFAAASNVTGTLVDVNAITVCLHQHGALSFWDYATAAPYVDIDMNPVVSGENQPYVYKDAIFFSTHKFVGGVQTPGILVAKKKLFRNAVPHEGGGGSVFFVRREHHRYLQETEMREEGGTPAIVECIRAGLVFQLKQAIGSQAILSRDEYLIRRAYDSLRDTRELVLLGSCEAERLPVFSFLVRHAPSGLFLHHSYAAALLNDLFGIQARGGCACAGPYAQELLGIDSKLAEEIESVILEDSRLDRTHLRRYREYSHNEILRPGLTRLNLPYFEDDETIDFVLDALRLVAQFGWRLLPHYTFNPETGEWRHRKDQVFKDRKWLGNLSYASGQLVYNELRSTAVHEPAPSLKDCLEEGKKILTSTIIPRVHLGDQSAMFNDVTSRLRWFLLPSEAYAWLQQPEQAAKSMKGKPPFTPQVYPKEVDSGKESWTTCVCKSGVSSRCRVHSAIHKLPLKAFSQKQEDDTVSTSTDDRLDNNGGSFQTGLERCLQDGFVGTETGHHDSEESHVDDLSNLKINYDAIVVKTDAVNTVESDPMLKQEMRDIKIESSWTLIESKSVEQYKQAGELSDSKSQSTESSSSTGTSDGNVIETSPTQNGEESNHSEIIVSTHDTSDACSLSNSGVCPCIQRPPKTEQEKAEEAKVAEEGIDKQEWHVAPRPTIFRPMCDAIKKYNMISNGDGVLVCLSGGKDSLTLLHSLHQYQYYSTQKGLHFRLGAVTIDPQTASYDPSPLKPYLKALGVPYFYEEQSIMEMAKSLPYECASICSYCSRMKRGRIYTAARREGYNVLAMGQHVDDLAESFLMSLFHNGLLRTMKAAYTVNKGDLRVIRPFVNVREKDLRAFAEEKLLPVIAENCPACFEAPKERDRMKQLLAGQEVLHPRLFFSIQKALVPLISIDRTGVNMNQIVSNMGRGKNSSFFQPRGKGAEGAEGRNEEQGES